MAPEIVSKKEYFGHPVDMWAAGILLHVMLIGSFPFKGKDDKSLFDKIKRGKNLFKLIFSYRSLRNSKLLNQCRRVRFIKNFGSKPLNQDYFRLCKKLENMFKV